MNEDIKKKIPSLQTQSAWLLFAKILGFSFSFILPLIVIRLLDQEEFGLYRQSFIVIMNAAAVLPLGFAMSAFYYLSRNEEKRASAVFNILLVHFAGGLLAFIVLFFFPQILGKVFDSPEMTRLAPVIGVAVWLWLFSMFLETVAVANQESKLATLFIVLAQFSKTALMVGAVLMFESVDSILYAAVIQGGLQTLILLIYLGYRFPKFWLKFDLEFFREHIVYAVPFGIAGILWTAQTDIHYYFVGNRFGEAMLAVYAVGCFQLPLVTMLSESVTSVLIPRMSELQLKDDRREMIRITARAMEKLAFFYFPIYVFLVITAETFIVTLFTRKYLESVPVFLVFLTLLPFHVLLSDPIVRAFENLGRFLLKLRIFTFIVLIIGLYLGIQYFSLRGIIAIVVGIRIAEKIFAETVVFRKIGVKFNDIYLLRNIGKTAVLSVLTGIITYFVYVNIRELMPGFGEKLTELVFGRAKIGVVNFISGSLILGICFAVYSSIYLVTSFLWGIIDEKEKKSLLKVLYLLKRPFLKKNFETPEKPASG
jgi:O-antigen/teichoic acid export membrane protein